MGNLEKIIGERDQLRSAIGKLAQVRQHEMESQKDFRIQRDEQHEMMQKFNNLMIDNKRLVADNDHKSSQLKQQTFERERLITEKKMILAERDRILEERHSLLSFSKSNTEGGATNELCRQLQEVISEKQVLQSENETLKRENDQLRKDKQTLLEQRDAAQFRVGALEAEKAHSHVSIKMEASDPGQGNNQVAAQAMLIENLRQDVSRLNAENQRLLEENTRMDSRPSPNRRPPTNPNQPPQLGKLENSKSLA